MRRVLSYVSANCTGCMNCVTNCPMYNEGVNGPTSSRIQIELDYLRGTRRALICRQCTKAPCAGACPVDAIRRAENAEYWYVDYETCIGCRACVDACPFGAMTFDPFTDKVMKCQTCDGDPTCVKSCNSEALLWRDVTQRVVA